MLLDERGSGAAAWTPDADGEITLRRFMLRRRIQSVAKRLFARQGYDHVSLQDIAVAADLQLDDLLRHYPDKDALLVATLEQEWKELLPRLGGVASNSITAHSAILGVLALMTGVLQKDPDLARLLLLEGRRPNPAGELGYSKGYRRFMHACRELVARGQRDGSFRPDYHPQVATSFVIGAFEGLLRDRLVSSQERDVTPYSGAELMSAYDAALSALKD